jgi:hypothetical protein
MAKKTPVKEAAAKKAAAPAKKAAPKRVTASTNIAAVCTTALEKLRELNLDIQLQGELEWCLGSYANDGNPVGLYTMAERALHEFKNLNAAQPKAVSAKLILDLEKAAKSKP